MSLQFQSNIIEVENLINQFGDYVVHQDLCLHVHQGEILAMVGASGCGKTTLTRSILMLNRPTSGTIRVFGNDLSSLNAKQLIELQGRWGVMFQHSSLFSSLTVLENVCFPLQEFTDLDQKCQKELAMLRIAQVGLAPSTAAKFPSELSGGMQKRVALARAIVLEPELVFLDEPTAGLDPHSADALETLILTLQQSLKLTVVVITHDLDTLWRIPTRVAYLGEQKVLSVEPMGNLVQNKDKGIQKYFTGPRSEWRIDYFQRYTKK